MFKRTFTSLYRFINMPVAEESICRFCLMPQETSKDPFISPCLCKGSAAYVHTSCLNKWRRLAISNIHRNHCQLCLEEFTIVRRWPIEILPPVKEDAWFILSRSYMFVILLYYMNYIICSKYLPRILSNNPLEYELYETTYSNGTYGFLILMGIVTGLYSLFYWTYISAIKNKLLYAIYWLRTDISCYTTITPIMYLITMPTLCYISSYYIFPFGGLYVLLLPRFLKIHAGIVRIMNREGEIPIE